MDSITGKLFAKSPAEAIVDINGIRFRIHISISTYESLPSVGSLVELLKHLHVKEDILDLFGFKDSSERDLFINLNTITGIGPRSAMNILSGTDPDEFKIRIVSGDVQSLTIIPGIGPKTAKRIIVELKEKFASDFDGKDELGFMESDGSSSVKDAVNALLSLGYKPAQINKTIKDLEKAGDLSGGLEEIIRKALAKMI